MDKVVCDDCKHEFHIEIKVKKLEEDIEQNYFKCPECNKEYLVTKTNSKARELRQELDKLQKQYNKRKTIDKFNLIKKKQKEFKKEMLKLNERVR